MSDQSIPFLGDWTERKPFADISETLKVENPAHMLEGWSRSLGTGAGGV